MKFNSSKLCSKIKHNHTAKISDRSSLQIQLAAILKICVHARLHSTINYIRCRKRTMECCKIVLHNRLHLHRTSFGTQTKMSLAELPNHNFQEHKIQVLFKNLPKMSLAATQIKWLGIFHQRCKI